MTISANSHLMSGPYEGNGTTTSFPFSFRAFGVPQYIAVWVGDETTGEDAVLLEHGADYTSTQNVYSETGTVHLLPAGDYPTLPAGHVPAIAAVFPEVEAIAFAAAERSFAPPPELASAYT